jgi:hypothetical protein
MVIEIDKSQAYNFKQSSHDLDCDTGEKWGRCEAKEGREAQAIGKDCVSVYQRNGMLAGAFVGVVAAIAEWEGKIFLPLLPSLFPP